MIENQKMIGKWKFEKTCTVTGKTRVSEQYNIIPTVGKTAFASQIANENTYNIGDNLYIAVGDDATAPNASDTTLGNETYRKAVSSTSFASNVANIVVFFASGEVTGTHREFGLFGDGNATQCTSSADTGILFSHVSANETISATETLTITFNLTFS